MSDDRKAYRIVREVGQERFEAACCGFMNQGYVPAGGPLVMEVVHPITGQSGMGFFQAMYLPAKTMIAASRIDLGLS